MNYQIGVFIKQLRVEKKLSQQQLADMIYIDRSVLSKWERGVSIPSIDKMKLLCSVLDISIDELISGERNNKNNIQSHRDNLFRYLINYNTKYKKLKFALFTSIFFLFLLIFFFLFYYFNQTYNSEKTYKIITKSNDYQINEGILFITREKSYLIIGSINNRIIDINLVYLENNKENLLFSGPSNSILIDFSGYNSKINHQNINNIKDNLYLKIDDSLVKLYFINNYKNNNILSFDNLNSNSFNEITKNNSEDMLLNKLKSDFDCNDDICTKIINKIKIDYIIETNSFYISDQDVYIQYEVDLDSFDYSSTKMNYSIEKGNFRCNSKNCDNYLESYNQYFKNIIEKYLS